MDTRTKIVSVGQAALAADRARAAGAPVCAVAGYFDPLLAGHARRLQEIRSQPDVDSGVLVAVVVEAPAPLLPARARAELVAGLAMVDYVVIAGEAVESLLERLRPDRVFREEAADQQRRRTFIARVQRKVAGV